MNPVSRRKGRLLPVLIVALGFAVAVSCSDNESPADPLASGLTARFTADADPTPVSVTLQSDSQSGTAFNVSVVVTGIDNFYGATFDILYDPAVIALDGLDTSGSLLIDGSVSEEDLNAVIGPSSLGDGFDITVSRNDANIDGVPMEADEEGVLVVLEFRARRATDGSPIELEDLLVTTCLGSTCDTLSEPTVTTAGGTLVAD